MRARFATSNPHKFSEVRRILLPFGIELTHVPLRAVEPQADRLEEVVRAKLRSLPPSAAVTLVEDSGLFLDGVGGFPGVYSAYVYRTVGLAGVLRLLRGRPRAARFRTVVGIRDNRSFRIVSGEVRGRIATRERGAGGFGYDPLFVPEEEARTFAQMEPEEKDRYSHRGRAFRAAGRFLQDLHPVGSRPRDGRRG